MMVNYRMERRVFIQSLCGSAAISAAGCLQPDCETCLTVSNRMGKRVAGTLQIWTNDQKFETEIGLDPDETARFEPKMTGNVNMALDFDGRHFEATRSVGALDAWGNHSIHIYSDDVDLLVSSH